MDVDVRDLTGPYRATVLPSAVWTEREAIFWSGLDASQQPSRSAISYMPGNGRWRSLADAPIEGRAGASATWTGAEMLVWGGAQPSGRMALDGAAYDVETDSWRTIAAAPDAWLSAAANAWRQNEEWPAQVWTGAEWVIGFKDIGDEAFDVGRFVAYDPRSDRWRRLPDTPVVRTLEMHLLWTGSEIVLIDFDRVSTLSPSSHDWVASESPPAGLPTLGAPVWTGDRVIAPIYRFEDGTEWGFLAEWTPEGGPWRTLAPPPSGSFGDLVAKDGVVLTTGSPLAHEIGTDRWWTLSNEMSTPREEDASIWTGEELIVWGGTDAGEGQSEPLQAGVIFTPSPN